MIHYIYIHNDLASKEDKVQKLIAELGNKKNYVIRYRNLQQCIQNGLVLKNIYKGVNFLQKPWLKNYIDLNTLHRENAKNKFEKDFFKLMNNSVYGKTMEDPERRVDIKLISTWDAPDNTKTGRKAHCAKTLILKYNFHSAIKHNDNYYAIQMKRLSVLFNKQMYLEFAVLDLSKWKMYDFHYQYMKPKFQEELLLNYMDTDSFIYTIKISIL